ncbi:MAG: glycosyltransferase [Bacteroidota bacterium]|jgi:glycosyltransferase involved in cell wall biosynthesis
MVKICHVSSAHPYNDIRIFKKECISLAKNNFELYYVSNNNENKYLDGVYIVGTGYSTKSRLKRMTLGVLRVFILSLKTNAKLYHLHDPELLLVAPLYLLLRKKVVFDAHEDLPAQIQDKYYLNKNVRKILSKSLSVFEKIICKMITGCIGATPHISQKFSLINNNVENINNFPLLGELSSNNSEYNLSNNICFTGSISEIRGIFPLINALEFCPGITLILAGVISPESILPQLQALNGWKQVRYLGLVNRTELAEIMGSCFAGIVTFLPAQNHIYAQPNKMFEYMSAGLPVVGSDFELWRRILVDNKCGLTVDPNNSKLIAEAINRLHKNFEVSKIMSKNSIAAVKEKYNWEMEEKKLINFYNLLLSK